MKVHHFKGQCSCGQWVVEIACERQLSDLHPRMCTCNYCQDNPSQILSDVSLNAKFKGGQALVRRNGDELASFFYCAHCNDFLGVGREINGVFRGAISAALLADSSEFGAVQSISPQSLSADEKLERWARLWGRISGFEAI